MAKSLFGIDLGLLIEDDNGNEVALIPSNGPPGNTTVTDNAPKGSLALDFTTGNLYTKITAGAGTSAWQQGAGGGSTNSSWREPALVKDDSAYSSLAAAQTAAQSGTIDGVAISAGARILFTNIVGQNQNVYIWDGSNLVEDTNLATEGDTLYVITGSEAGKTFTYNGSAWVLSNQTSQDELGYLRAFIGKNAAGNELPAYSSQNFITDGDSLESAIGKLDTQVQDNLNSINTQASNITNLQAELDALELSTGMNPDGTFSQFSGSNYLDTSTSLKDALSKLDVELNNQATVDSNLQTEIDSIESAVGLDANGNYTAPAGSNYLGSTTSVLGALGSLDSQIFTNASNISSLQTTATNLQAEVDNIESATGMNPDGTFSAYSGTNYIDSALSMKAADELLDAQIKANADAISTLQSSTGDEVEIRAFIGKGAAGVEAPNYSSAETITQGANLETAIGELDEAVSRAIKQQDSTSVSGSNNYVTVATELVDKAKLIHWEVYIIEPTTGKVNSYDVVATHDGTSSADATDWDYTVSHKLRVGGKIQGGRVRVSLNGSGASQSLNLEVRSAANPVDVSVIRRIIK